MTPSIRIDFVSDVSCPWCAIGLQSLEVALAKLNEHVAAEIHFQPFELNPNMAMEGQDLAEHLAKKYGRSPAQLEQSAEAIRAKGAALGFTFNIGSHRRIYNTFDAHRLLYWADLEDKQPALKHALLRAYFTDGKNPSSHDTLVEVAAEVGLDAVRTRAILASDEFAQQVHERENYYFQQGILAVPSVIINQRHLIQGGQPPEVFEQALREIAAAQP
jgi:predicted DsbA family dithiol-disulfide isomerase